MSGDLSSSRRSLRLFQITTGSEGGDMRTFLILLVPISLMFSAAWWMQYSPRALLCRQLGGEAMNIYGECYRNTYTPTRYIKLPD
jgi:hypothetical protein